MNWTQKCNFEDIWLRYGVNIKGDSSRTSRLLSGHRANGRWRILLVGTCVKICVLSLLSMNIWRRGLYVPVRWSCPVFLSSLSCLRTCHSHTGALQTQEPTEGVRIQEQIFIFWSQLTSFVFVFCFCGEKRKGW